VVAPVWILLEVAAAGSGHVTAVRASSSPVGRPARCRSDDGHPTPGLSGERLELCPKSQCLLDIFTRSSLGKRHTYCPFKMGADVR
jgi:hypothetical protein